jgi:hypothetical protein
MLTLRTCEELEKVWEWGACMEVSKNVAQNEMSNVRNLAQVSSSTRFY